MQFHNTKIGVTSFLSFKQMLVVIFVVSHGEIESALSFHFNLNLKYKCT